ncbi:uncharacterized protein [Anabrus simplex]|uniref:uncharacterized protein n=1 Tax=Anabrus simplex TaxID=316456 RepID=UPI0035A266F9
MALYRVFILLISLAVITHAGYINGDCQLLYQNGTPLQYIDWLYDLFLQPAIADISPVNTEIAIFKAVNIMGIVNHYSKYIDVELRNGSLILSLKKAFSMFEEMEENPALKLNVNFRCNEGSAGILMHWNVEDTNNHNPKFVIGASENFTFTLPLPFPPGIPLSCTTGIVVAATDVDFSTSALYFSFVEDHGLIVTGAWRAGRTYYPNITTNSYITEEADITLKVTDNGEPPRSTLATVHIRAHPTLSMKKHHHG